MQVKPKLTSPLRNVTLVVASRQGYAVGEIQLKLVDQAEISSVSNQSAETTAALKHIAFIDHFLYELRRIYENIEVFHKNYVDA